MSLDFGAEQVSFDNIKLSFGECRLRKVGDLFQVSTGLIQSRYTDRVAESNFPVCFLSLGAFDYDQNRIKNDDERNKLKMLKPKNHTNQTGKKSDIPYEKVLNLTDYIINMRGEPKGFSMVDALDIASDLNYVCANQFFVLRPNKDIPYSIPYLHQLLDLVVIPTLQKVYKSKKDEISLEVGKNKILNLNVKSSGQELKASEKISFNSFTMSHLSEISMNVLVNLTDQEKIIEKLKVLKALKLEAINNEKTFNESFQKFSIDNSTK